MISSSAGISFLTYRIIPKPLIDTKTSSRPEVFCEKEFLNNSTIFTRKHLCWSLFLLKLQSILNFINIAKFLKTAFFTEHLCWLLLYQDQPGWCTKTFNFKLALWVKLWLVLDIYKMSLPLTISTKASKLTSDLLKCFLTKALTEAAAQRC